MTTDEREKALAEREERRRLQERFMAVYDEVREELMRIPGVVDVGVALREVGGALTNEFVFRVDVEEKLPASDVPPEQLIPKEIRGFPTDVVKRRDALPIIGFDDENDTANYPIKAGGQRIGPDSSKSSSKGHGTGTLGCFARRTTDNQIVLLSNLHVLMQREFDDKKPRGTDNNIGVGQPDYSGSWCCTCNEIATTADGDFDLDCAIAVLKPDVKFAAKVRRIKRSDGTDELTGDIAGSDTPVVNDQVWKVGARTGLTRGTINAITNSNTRLEITPLATFPKVADHGDSGSVIVNNLTSKVVGLLRAIDTQTGKLGIGISIVPILAKMNITILLTADIGEFDVKGYDEDVRLGEVREPEPSEVFAAVADRLDMTETGRAALALFRRHLPEVSELINRTRPVTIAWHRAQGPTYLAAIMRSVREPAYSLPESLSGVARGDALARLSEALKRFGSEELRAAIGMHEAMLTRAWLESRTTDELLCALEQSEALAPVHV
jgi:hypothetical protein